METVKKLLIRGFSPMTIVTIVGFAVWAETGRVEMFLIPVTFWVGVVGALIASYMVERIT